ncbi:hypothetical protein [Mesonia sp. K4-1]|uniref:hypothetical protein n=1 Tax=Mesonia sp. K4-1 TaxID=2602760 RepID=UPI0011CCACA8|nr:hypothetical protein [Mesonia sp. K4-1]TXK76886.1 hypothetical protein FT986_05845 [Mesonia sp. K4-1]
MRKLILISLLIINLFSCKNNDKPTVTYDNLNDKKEITRDSSIIVINELPIEIDSTDYLVYIIGEPSNISYGSSYSGFSSESNNRNSFSVINSYNSTISGKIHNLKFQKFESDTITQLTNETILINSVDFLREIFNINKKQYLLYTVYDNDSNADQKINYQDLRSLYMSEINGQGFKKLTPDFQELINWKIIKSQNRLYFRTIEDIDKNGEFDNEDKLHYFYIDFDKDNLKSKEYNYI